MCADIAKSNVPSLVSLLDECSTIFGMGEIPRQLVRPILNIGRSSSCCGLMQAAGTDEYARQTREILARFCDGVELTDCDVRHLQRSVPLVLDFINGCLQNCDQGCTREYCRKIVHELVCCMLAPFEKSPIRSPQDYPMTTRQTILWRTSHSFLISLHAEGIGICRIYLSHKLC